MSQLYGGKFTELHERSVCTTFDKQAVSEEAGAVPTSHF